MILTGHVNYRLELFMPGQFIMSLGMLFDFNSQSYCIAHIKKKKSQFPAGALSGSSTGNKTTDIKNRYSAIVTVIICQRLCIMHFKPPRLAATSM